MSCVLHNTVKGKTTAHTNDFITRLKISTLNNNLKADRFIAYQMTMVLTQKKK